MRHNTNMSEHISLLWLKKFAARDNKEHLPNTGLTVPMNIRKDETRNLYAGGKHYNYALS